MKFKNYLNETTKYIDNIINGIKKDCQPYLKELEYIKNPLISGRNETQDFLRKKIRKNRRPKDTSMFIHDFFDNEFKKNLGIKLRSESLFCKTYHGDVSNYGGTFVIFPIGKYDLYYSNIIDDLYDYVDNIILKKFHISASTITNKFKENINHIWLIKQQSGRHIYLYNCDGISEKEVSEKINLKKDEEFKKITRNDLIQLLKDEDISDFYKKTKSWKNVYGNYEIMLVCDEVYMIKDGLYSDYENYITNNLYK